jgi:hypothetical protein
MVRTHRRLVVQSISEFLERQAPVNDLPKPIPVPVYYFTTQPDVNAIDAAVMFIQRHGVVPATCYTTTERGKRVTVVGPIPPTTPPVAPEGCSVN